MRAVEDVLEGIDAGAAPRLLVLNKCDLLDQERRRELRFRHPRAVLTSAVTGEGLDALAERIALAFDRGLRPVELLLPYSEGQVGSPSCTRWPASCIARRPPRACGSARACRPRWPSATSALR